MLHFSWTPHNMYLKHALVVTALLAWTSMFAMWTYTLKWGATGPPNIDPWVEYGTVLTIVLAVIKYSTLLALPKILTTVIGFIAFNTFPGPVEFKSDPEEAPFLCVRIVTRGLYPELVKYTLKRNISVLNSSGIKHFKIEVVTNNKISVAGDRVEEILLPSSYETKRGATNRARNLQYCLEEENDFLDHDAWIVHIDEETLLTEDSAKGIINFITEGKCDFGQGVISYAGDQQDLGSSWANFQHHMCTVADSFRVAVDMGQLRGQLKMLHKPIFGWKGPFIVARLSSLKEVSFDHGPESALAEDNFFAMFAMNTGKYRFGFVEGDMWERSPFSFADFFHQRRRWLQGWISLVSSSRIYWKDKLLFAMTLGTWLFMPLTVWYGWFFSRIFPLNSHPLPDYLACCIGAVFVFHYIFGYIKQFPVSR